MAEDNTPTNVVDNLITKNDLEKSIRDIAKEVEQSYKKGQTHSIFIQNLLDDLEKKGFDINNPENIKRLDNFALTNEFLNFQDLIDSDEIAPVSSIPVAAKGQEGLLETYSLSKLDDNLQIIDTPTNVVDDGIELYHSISKGETVNKNFHAGTYNAALDRASQFYGGEQLYKIAKDNVDFIQDQANDLVSELSEQVSFEKVENFYEVTDGMVTREITITLPTGVEANFNIVAETSNNDLTVRFQDLDGYDGEEIYSETLWDIENEPDNLKGVTSTIDIIDDENVAEGLLDEIGLKSQAGDFNYKDGYDLYKVNIKPGANVVNIPDTAIFVEFGIEKEMSSDFIQGFIERPKTVNQFTNVTQIKIGGKTYDITDTFTSAQALQEHFKDADVLVYTNDIEDVGSKSYMFLNENSYVLEKIDDAQFNIDVANKYIKNNPYETISKLARRESFTEPERYQVLLNALLDETDTPGGSLGAAKLNDPLVFDSWVDNLGRTTTSFVDNLPLETVVKNRIKNLITTKTKQLAKPGSLVVKAVDAWEFGVIGLMAAGIAFNEIDEVPTIINNTAINMFNSMTAPYGIAPVEKEEYDIDYEFINTVLNTGSKVMPTDIIIEKLKPYSLEEGEDVILPGTGVTATTGAKQQFEPYGEELAKRAEKTVNMKRDEVKQKILESKGVQEEKMFEQAKPKKSKATGGAGAKIL